MSVHVFAHVRQADGVGSLLLLADNMIRVRAEIPRFVSFWMANRVRCNSSTGPDQKSLGRD